MKKLIFVCLSMLVCFQAANAVVQWKYHFSSDYVHPDADPPGSTCPGGNLTVWATIDCQKQQPPIFTGYAVKCKTYTGIVPDFPINDVSCTFAWDYACKNVDEFKIAIPYYDKYEYVWKLDYLAASLEDITMTEDLFLPAIGDPTGNIQNVYTVVDVNEWFQDPRPMQDEYYIVEGECDDLPGFLIGTTPIVFDPCAESYENPFSTTALTGTLYLDGDLTFTGEPVDPCLGFYQSDFVLDGSSFADTNNGAVDLTYTGTSNVRYFNLAVDDDWVIQNVPVLSQDGIGVSHTKTYSFPMNVPSGTPVGSLLYDYRLTDDPVQEMPDGIIEAPVADREYVISGGGAGVDIPDLSPLVKLIGHLISGPEHSNAGFQSSDCNDSECTPAAVSDSMNFLNEEHDMDLEEGDIDIDDMKGATNWGEKDLGGGETATGAWIDHDDDRAEGEQNAWWEDKDEYMQENNIPVTTTKVDDLGELGEELDEGQDVELQGDWHTAAVTGITDLGNGDYAIDVSHDTKQGTDGGVQTDTIIYDSDTGKFTGSPGFFNGSSFRYAIVECPKKEPNADLDESGFVDFFDFAYLANQWLTPGAPRD